jgi:ATP-dependent protease ClpP protease subunit
MHIMDITIEGEIGWDITESDVSTKLQSLADFEDLNIRINSPGGSIPDGIAIFNALREQAKKRSVSVTVLSIAASMASYIALSARTVNPTAKVKVFNDSVFIIHNPYCLAAGDYRELEKRADYLQRLAAMFCSTYSAVSGKSKDDIQDAINEETYYVGKEITEAGFANDFEEINPADEEIESERNSLLVNASMCIDTAKKNAREREKPEDFERIAALLQETFNKGEGWAPGQVYLK